jgi:hypothetical protein
MPNLAQLLGSPSFGALALKASAQTKTLQYRCLVKDPPLGEARDTQQGRIARVRFPGHDQSRSEFYRLAGMHHPVPAETVSQEKSWYVWRLTQDR